MNVTYFIRIRYKININFAYQFSKSRRHLFGINHIRRILQIKQMQLICQNDFVSRVNNFIRQERHNDATRHRV